jgi:hypothetical protein
MRKNVETMLVEILHMADCEKKISFFVEKYEKKNQVQTFFFLTYILSELISFLITPILDYTFLPCLLSNSFQDSYAWWSEVSQLKWIFLFHPHSIRFFHYQIFYLFLDLVNPPLS